MKIKIFHSIYLKYLVSYLALLIVPVIIIGIFVYTSFNSILADEVQKNSREKLIQIKNSLDLRLEELTIMALQISHNKFLSASVLNGKLYETYTASELLKNFTYTSNFFNEFYIYYKDDNLLYSSTGTYSKEYFIGHNYSFEGWNNGEKFFSWATSNNKPMYMVVKSKRNTSLINSKKILVCSVPIPFESVFSSGAVIFFTGEDVINKSLSDFGSKNRGQVLIIDPQKGLLFGSEAYYSGLPKELDYANMAETGKQPKTLDINGSLFYCAAIESSMTGWIYVSLVPTDEISVQVRVLKYKSVFIFVFTLFAGFILIYFLLRINYKPIKDLTAFASGIFQKPRKLNELEYVNMAFTQMNTVIHDFHIKMEETVVPVRNKILIDLLKGSFESIEGFNEKGRNVGLYFSAEYFFAAVFMVHTDSTTIEGDFIKNIESVLPDGLEGYGLETQLQKTIIMILSTSENNMGYITEKIRQVHLHLKALGMNSTIGIGSLCTTTDAIGNSYIQASSALDYRFIKGNNTVIHFGEIGINFTNNTFYPREKLEKLEISLFKMDPDEVMDLITQITGDISNKGISLYEARSLCFSIISLINSFLTKHNVDPEKIMAARLEVLLLAKFETVEELSFRLKVICQEIFSSIINNNDLNSHEKRFKQIIEYINNSFQDSNLSIQSLADKFGFSLSGLSLFFKSHANDNISNYINKLRMEKAKKLLKETDKPIQSIAVEVGYMNTSSFIRKYKQYTGYTPGLYREALK